MEQAEDHIRIAILDMNEGTPNEGIRGIRQSIEEFEADFHLPVKYSLFDVRSKAEVPSLDFDLFISSGGPGSPIDTVGMKWERRYFDLLDSIREHNRSHTTGKKHILLICHSFQLFCRYYQYAHVSKRKGPSFGVMPVHKTSHGHRDPLLRSLGDPFWAVDSRDYQVTQPKINKIKRDGGNVLAIEKYRPEVNLERAVMAIRFDECIFGTQFHPEADAVGIRSYLLREDKKEMVIEKHGEEKYWNVIDHLNDPDKIMDTYNTILPRFLMIGLQHRIPHTD